MAEESTADADATRLVHAWVAAVRRGAAPQRCRRRRGRRLSGDDLNDALESLGDERVLGHPRRSLVATLNGLATLEPKELDLDAVEAEARQRALVAAPPEAALALSWLAVD